MDSQNPINSSTTKHLRRPIVGRIVEKQQTDIKFKQILFCASNNIFREREAAACAVRTCCKPDQSARAFLSGSCFVDHLRHACAYADILFKAHSIELRILPRNDVPPRRILGSPQPSNFPPPILWRENPVSSFKVTLDRSCLHLLITMRYACAHLKDGWQAIYSLLTIKVRFGSLQAPWSVRLQFSHCLNVSQRRIQRPGARLREPIASDTEFKDRHLAPFVRLAGEGEHFFQFAQIAVSI